MQKKARKERNRSDMIAKRSSDEDISGLVVSGYTIITGVKITSC